MKPASIATNSKGVTSVTAGRGSDLQLGLAGESLELKNKQSDGDPNSKSKNGFKGGLKSSDANRGGNYGNIPMAP